MAANQGKVLNDTTVKLTGAQSVAGVKTLTDIVRATAGINFNASGGDTLDEYDIVDFSSTFRIFDATSGGNQSSTTPDYARGIRIGRYFFFEFRFGSISTSGMTGGNDAWFIGLPFVIRSGNTYRPTFIPRTANVAYSNSRPHGLLLDNTNRFRLDSPDSGGGTASLTVSNISSGSIDGNGFYQIN